MSEQTPTTEQVRAAFVARHGELRPTEARRVFERWLVAHDAEVKAEALEEAPDNVRASDWYPSGRSITTRARSGIGSVSAPPNCERGGADDEAFAVVDRQPHQSPGARLGFSGMVLRSQRQ